MAIETHFCGLSDVKNKIFTFLGGNVVHKFEFVTFTNLLNHLMSSTSIKMSCGIFKIFIQRFHIYPHMYPRNQLKLKIIEDAPVIFYIVSIQPLLA